MNIYRDSPALPQSEVQNNFDTLLSIRFLCFVQVLLPYYSEFSNICTIGPHGKMMNDINGKAVAII